MSCHPWVDPDTALVLGAAHDHGPGQPCPLAAVIGPLPAPVPPRMTVDDDSGDPEGDLEPGTAPAG